MNFNNISLIKIGNGSEITLVKLGNGPIVYEKNQGMTIYKPYDFKESDITDVKTIVNNTHTSLDNMFKDCRSLKTVNTPDWDVSNVTDMSLMFYYCSSLPSLDVSNWDTGSVTDMNSMFMACASLTSLDLSAWDVSNVTDMRCMFKMCGNLKVLDLSNWKFNSTSYVNTAYIFDSCNNLHTLRLDNCDTKTIKTILESNNFPTNVIEDGVTRKIYCRESQIKSGGITYISEPPENWEFVFIAEPYKPYEFKENYYITEAKTMVNETHTSLEDMFMSCWKLTTVDTTDWNTSNVTRMGRMFMNCEKLTSLDVSNWDVSKVTDTRAMFSYCSSLTSLDLSNWKADCLVDMWHMFSDCSSLRTLDVKGFKTNNVTDMECIFSGCSSLTSISGLAYWNTSNVTDMGYLFYNCSSLTSLDLSTWNVSKVTNMGRMFENCEKLTSLDVRGWSYDKVELLCEEGYLPSGITIRTSLTTTEKEQLASYEWTLL